MRNLQLLYHKQKQIDVDDVQKLRLSSDDDNLTFLATRNEISQINLQNDERKVIYQTNDSKIVEFEHLPIANELSIATEGGDVVRLNIETLQTESVTFCDGGIEAMSWSPTQEVVAFATKTKFLVVMDSSYDPINEHNLDDPDFGSCEFISLGWGKKETQFHGTAGKQAAKQQNEIGLVQPEDKLDKKISIVWRGDGELFAVSFVRDGFRLFQVYDKEGKLQYTSEKRGGLEAAIDWRPMGTWIGVPQILPNKYLISLFEKNGLKHREIVLPFIASEEKVIRLAWSSDSEVLAVETNIIQSQKSIIYLYTICNYHWYMKQTLKFVTKVKDFQWDNKFSEGKSLHILLDSGEYNIYRWEYKVNHSNSLQPEDNAIVAVIDGKNILLTNFRQVVIPPPMCAQTIKAENYLNYVEFQRNSKDPNAFFAIDTSNTIITYNWDPDESKCVQKYNLKNENDKMTPLLCHHWTWIDRNLIVFAKTMPDGSSELYLCKMEITNEEGTLTIIDTTSFPSVIGAIDFAENFFYDKWLVVHLTCGSTYTIMVDESNKFSGNSKRQDLPYFCEIIRAVFVERKLKIFSLKHRQTLYLNENKLATDVTSIFLTENFLAFTIVDQLKFIRLSDGQIINERQMERGGKLICIVSHDSRTVLQMPRGNLEAIQPRLLSLCIIGDLLDSGEYYKAYDIMRRQRIDLNLIVDHNPEKFYEEITKFIDSINDPHWMNLFLSDLGNSDVTKDMYKSNYIDREPNDSQAKTKTSRICEEISKVLIDKGLYKWFLSIITAYVKNSKTEEALRMIWTLKEKETASSAETINTNLGITANKALKYLSCMVDSNQLYRCALGMYDLNIVLFIAEKSQKDPKEYLPFLNTLKQHDESYRKYKIDCHLKRHRKALEHISVYKEDKLEETLVFIEKHCLYVYALPLYKTSKECYEKIAFKYAEYLRTMGNVRDAVLMYERAGDLQQAILSAKHTLDWQKCILLAMRLELPEETIIQLLVGMIPALKNNGNYNDAVYIALQYDRNVDTAIKILCDALYYHKAIYQAQISEREELIEKYIKPHLLYHVRTTLERIERDQQDFNEFKTRLLTVRKEKEERKLTALLDDNEIDECDVLSETSSMNSSRFSRTSHGSTKSHRSSKNRRKHERKLYNLKPGNPFEDIALINALYIYVHRAYDEQKSMSYVLKGLIELDLEEKGAELQKAYSDELKAIKDSLDEIWIPEIMTAAQVPTEGDIDYLQFQNELHYALIKPNQRIKPELVEMDWEYDILKIN